MASSNPRPDSQKQAADLEEFHASYTACWTAFKDTEARLEHRDAQYMQLLDVNRALRDEKRFLLDRIRELEAIRMKYEPTARPEAYPRVQNMNAADRAVFTHAVLGAHHAPRKNSATSAAEHPDARRESSSLARKPSASQLPQERNGDRRPPPPPPSDRPVAGPAPKPVMLPPAAPTEKAGKLAVPSPTAAPAPKVIQIEEYQPDVSPGQPKRKFVQVDPSLPPQKRGRPSGPDAASRSQAPVWYGPPLQTHMAPPLSPTTQRQHAAPVSPPVGPYGHAPPMPTHSAERSTVRAETDSSRLYASRHGSSSGTRNGDPPQRS